MTQLPERITHLYIYPVADSYIYGIGEAEYIRADLVETEIPLTVLLDAVREDALREAAALLEYQSSHIGLDQDGCPYVGEEAHCFAGGALHNAASDILALINKEN